jgi:muramoyltetrapeptide carboxypeptidase
MIIAGRGGYGATRILDRIDYQGLMHDPKIVAGFSDVTALNCAILAQANLVSFSGAMPGVDFWDETIDAFAEQSFWQAVTSTEPPGVISQPTDHPVTPLHPGTAEGWLLPANLTLLTTIVGTPYLPDLTGAVLLIEEIGEEAYRLDRHLSQLYNAGVLNRINALALGAFTGTDAKRISVDPLPVEEVFNEYISRAAVPAIGGVLYGHIDTKLTLPLGVRVRVDGDTGAMEVCDAGVR